MRDLFEKIKIYGFRKSISYACAEVVNRLYYGLIRHSYSQHGEDLLLDKLLGWKKSGFYVDVGANHPHRFSNTKRFYDKGWNGINIEPNPVLIEPFKMRKNDISLNIGISSVQADSLEFYSFVPDTLSTFSKEVADSYIRQGFRLHDVLHVEVKPLVEVLREYAGGKKIDFMNIDVEGFEMEILRSNDFSMFRPRLLCMESIRHELDGAKHVEVYDQLSFLRGHGYELVHFNGLNSIYMDLNATFS